MIENYDIKELRLQRDELLAALNHIIFTVRQQKCSITEFQAQQIVVNTAQQAIDRVTK